MKIELVEQIEIEVRNETNKKIFVSLCRTGIMGNLYLHIDCKKSKHISNLVKPQDYAIIQEKRCAA